MYKLISVNDLVTCLLYTSPQVAYLEPQPQHWQSHQAPCKSLHPPIDQRLCGDGLGEVLHHFQLKLPRLVLANQMCIRDRNTSLPGTYPAASIALMIVSTPSSVCLLYTSFHSHDVQPFLMVLIDNMKGDWSSCCFPMTNTRSDFNLIRLNFHTATTTIATLTTFQIEMCIRDSCITCCWRLVRP